MPATSEKEYEARKEEYEKAIQAQPDDVHSYVALAEFQFDHGKIDEVIALCSRAVQVDPKNVEAHTLLGFACYEKGDLERALEHYQTALESNPDDAKLHNNMGVIYLEEKLWDEAIESFKLSLSLQKDSKTHSNLGVALFEKGLKEEAKMEFEEAVKMDPDEITAHYYLGAEYQHKGEWKVGSILKIGQVLKMHPLGELGKQEYDKVYSVRIEDMDENSITISAPLVQGVPLPLRPGKRLIIGTPRDDALYGFTTEITDRKGGDIPVFKIYKKVSARRVQRRNFVRVDTNIEVNLTVISPKELAKKTISNNMIVEKNISAGGMLIISTQLLLNDAELEIFLNMPDGKVKVLGTVVRSKIADTKERYEIGISFHNLDDHVRKQITRYVYARQVDLRKKGLA